MRPRLLPSWRALGVFFLALLAVLCVFFFTGIHQNTAVLGPLLAWGASFTQVVLGVFLVWVAVRESTPGHRLPRVAVWGAAGLSALMVVGVSLWTFHVRPIMIPARFSPWRVGFACGENGTLAAVILLVAICLTLGRRSLAAHPALVGALFGEGAGIVVNAGWRLSCPASLPSHALGAHGGPIVITTLVGALLATALAKVARRGRGRAANPSSVN